MGVKHAVLGLLLERRGYGYDLMQRLEERLGPAWQLNPSTVYAALDQLQEDGWIVGREPIEGESGPRPQRQAKRVVYDATESGHTAFTAWLGEPSWRPEPVRGELQLKVAAARPDDGPALLAAIDHAELLARRLCEECRRGAPALGSSPGPTGGELARASAVYHLEAELRWLEETRRALLLERPSRSEGREGRSSQPAAL